MSCCAILILLCHLNQTRAHVKVHVTNQLLKSPNSPVSNLRHILLIYTTPGISCALLYKAPRYKSCPASCYLQSHWHKGCHRHAHLPASVSIRCAQQLAHLHSPRQHSLHRHAHLPAPVSINIFTTCGISFTHRPSHLHNPRHKAVHTDLFVYKVPDINAAHRPGCLHSPQHTHCLSTCSSTCISECEHSHNLRPKLCQLTCSPTCTSEHKLLELRVMPWLKSWLKLRRVWPVRSCT